METAETIPFRCPYCSSDLKGAPIPNESLFGDLTRHYSRVIGIYDRSRDRTVAWRCPDCDTEWERE